MKVVATIRFKNTSDKSFYIDLLALLVQGEMTAGFLVLCIPPLPKFFKDIPLFQRLFSSGTPKPNSRLGLPSWIPGWSQRRAARRRHPDDIEYTEYGDVSQFTTLDDSQLSPSTIAEKSAVTVADQEELSQAASQTGLVLGHEVR